MTDTQTEKVNKTRRETYREGQSEGVEGRKQRQRERERGWVVLLNMFQENYCFSWQDPKSPPPGKVQTLCHCLHFYLAVFPFEDLMYMCVLFPEKTMNLINEPSWKLIHQSVVQLQKAPNSSLCFSPRGPCSYQYHCMSRKAQILSVVSPDKVMNIYQWFSWENQNVFLCFHWECPKLLPVVLPKNAPNLRMPLTPTCGFSWECPYLWFYLRMHNAPNSHLWFYLRMLLTPTCGFTWECP